jgi:hypothetical protein
MRSIGPVSQTIGIQLDALQKDSKTLHASLQDYIYSIINKQSSNKGLSDKKTSDEELIQSYHNLKNDINIVYSSLLPLKESKLTANDVAKLSKIENVLQSITDTAKSYKNIASNVREIISSDDPMTKEL